MFKKLLAILSTSLVAFIVSFQPAQAIVRTEHQGALDIPADELIDDDLYLAGEIVNVDGTVNGDLYVAGGTVNIRGTINGDVIVAGGTVTVADATIEQDLRSAGGSVIVSNTSIGDSLTAFGGTISIIGGNIDGGVNFLTGNQLVNSIVGRGILGAGGSVTIDSQIGKDVLVGVGSLSMGSTSTVGGDLTYYSEQPAQISNSAKIDGRTNYHQTYKHDSANRKEARKKALATSFGFKIWAYLATLFSGIILLKFFPQITTNYF